MKKIHSSSGTSVELITHVNSDNVKKKKDIFLYKYGHALSSQGIVWIFFFK